MQSINIPSKLESETILFHKIDGLNPYTKYTFFIQCSLPDCFNNYCWGALTGPVIAMTKEEGWVSIEVIYYFIYLSIFCGVCKRITLVNYVVPETIPTLLEWTRIPGGRGWGNLKGQNIGLIRFVVLLLLHYRSCDGILGKSLF